MQMQVVFLGHKLLNKIRETCATTIITVHEPVNIRERDTNAVVCHAVLRKIVRPDTLAAIRTGHLGPTHCAIFACFLLQVLV